MQADLDALETLRRHACPHTEAQTFAARAVDEIMAFHDRVEAGTSDPLDMNAERLTRTLAAHSVTCTAAHLQLYAEALIHGTRPAPGVTALLTALRRRGLRLALLSNAYDGPAQRARIDACFPDRPFEVIVVAGEGATLKPDPQPFRLMLAQLGQSADRGVYVGDSPEHDVAGAVAAGLRAVLVHPHPRVQQRGSRLGAAQAVSSLDALAGLLAHD